MNHPLPQTLLIHRCFIILRVLLQGKGWVIKRDGTSYDAAEHIRVIEQKGAEHGGVIFPRLAPVPQLVTKYQADEGGLLHNLLVLPRCFILGHKGNISSTTRP